MTDMSSWRAPSGRTGILLATVVISALVLTSCRENNYLGRRDSVTLGAGDPHASNTAVHMVDPWPRYARDKNINVDGKRMQLAIERYQKNESIEPVGTDTTERFKDEEPPEDPPEGGPKLP